MSDDTVFAFTILGLLAAAIVLIVTGHGIWVAGALVLVFLCSGG